MKQINIKHFVLYPRESAVEGLERVYQMCKHSPPDAIAFSDDDDNQLFHWEDVEILHFLPTREANRYYWILQTRDKIFNGKRSAEYLAETIAYYLQHQ